MKLAAGPDYYRPMAHANMELMNLRRKRAYCHKKLAQLEPWVASLNAKLTETEAAIRAIAPELPLAHRYHKRNAIFARGELARLALTVLREANGPMSMRAIMTRMLAIKGLDLPDRAVREHTAGRVCAALVALRRRGLARYEGWGVQARWRTS